MIWNYPNIIKNLIFLCFTFIFYCIFFITEAKTQSAMKICDSTNKGWQSTDNNTYGADICTTKCSDLKVDGTGYPRGSLSSGGYGMCAGSATSSPIEIYKIVLGTTTGGFNGTDKCTIFDGKIVTDFAKVGKGQTLGRGEIKTDSCNKQTYDRVYFYINRIQSISGNTFYPDNSGKIARTTAACATDNLSATVTDLSWLDVTATSNWVNSSLCYGRQSNTWNSSVIKTINDALSITDYSSASNIDNEYDDFKNMYLNSLDPIGGAYTSSSVPNMVPSDTTFYAECCGGGIYNGVKLDPTNSSNEILVLINGSDTITGSGIGKRFSKKKKQSLEFNYFALSSTKDFGVKFVFRRNGTSAELLGAQPDDNGLYVTYNQF